MQQKAMLNQHIPCTAEGDQEGTMSKRLTKMAEKEGFPENQLNMG